MQLKTILMDEVAVNRALSRISHEIIEKNKGASNIAFLGIVTRGEPMAELLSQKIFLLENIKVPIGKIDITNYRDDLNAQSKCAEKDKTVIDFDVTGKDIIICDDVMFTGRTVRCAIDAIIKLGRPKTIQLAVLIDRGHRELPIRADYVGKNIPTSKEEIVSVKFNKSDKQQTVLLYSKN